MKTGIFSIILIVGVVIYCVGANRAQPAYAETFSTNAGSNVFETAQAKDFCDIRAYLNDPDSNGTNVRSKPDKNSPVVKLLKSENEKVVTISSSSSGGWFEVSKIQETGTDDERVIFQGRGWIHSSLLGMDVAAGDPVLYSQPEKKSRVLKKLIPDGSPLKLMGCRNKWAKVQTGKLIGWLAPEHQCSNPLTTCS